MQLKKGYAVRMVLGEPMLMPVDHYSRGREIYSLNEVAAFIFKNMEQPICKKELLDVLLKEYDVDYASAEQAVNVLIDPFVKLGLVEGSWQ